MTARAEKFTFQTRPTPAQNAVILADHAKRYRDIQEAAAEFQVARLRYEMERMSQQPEPAQFCAVDEDEATDIPLAHFLAVSIASLGLWAAIGYATWWIAPKVADLIAWILEMNA